VAWLWWIAAPLLLTALGAVVVFVWARPRPPADPIDSVADHERFLAAMARVTARRAPHRPLPTERPASPRRPPAGTPPRRPPAGTPPPPA